MDLIAWSPAVCKELKRLCTRVAKKRAAKPLFLKIARTFQSYVWVTGSGTACYAYATYATIFWYTYL